MSDAHPQREALEAFLRAELAPAESRVVVRHLLTGCRLCRQVTSRHRTAPIAGTPVDEGRLAGTPELDFERVLERVIERRSRLSDDWAHCHRLTNQAKKEGFDNPAAALETARLAVEAAEMLNADHYGLAPVQDARVRAWATLGNARRINSDLAGAEKDICKGLRLLEQGTGNPLEQARLVGFLGFLRRAQRRFPEAARLFDKQIGIYRRLGDDHLLGVAWTNKGTVLGDAADLDRAIDCYRKGLELLDPRREARMVLVANHNLSWCLLGNGDITGAQAVLEQVRQQHVEQGNRMDLLRLRWVEAQLAQARGEPEEAERALLEVQAGFIEAEIAYDVALVSLELATLYLEERRFPEIRRLAAQMLQIFRSLQVDRETLASLALFYRAAEMETLTLRFIRELASRMKSADKNPGRHFMPSPGAG